MIDNPILNSPFEEPTRHFAVVEGKFTDDIVSGRRLSTYLIRLHKGLERRLYELARKHCGLQAKFTIGLDTLLKKSGAMCSLREFRRQIREIVSADALPDYTISFDDKSDLVTLWTRDGGRRLRRMIQEVHERGINTLDIARTQP